MQKTIYVKDSSLWGRFEKAAEWSGDSVSGLISIAMGDYLAQFGDQGDGLFVAPPDCDPGDIVFGEGRSAILERRDRGWVLSFDDGDDYVLCSADVPVGTAVKEARGYLEQRRRRMAGEALHRIEVEVGEDLYAHRKAFVGRWLLEPDSDTTRSAEPSQDAGTYWGVALTKGGRFAVYAAHCNGRFPASLRVFDSIADAELPEDIERIARTAVGEDVVVELDI
jgi:hypothetical protein